MEADELDCQLRMVSDARRRELLMSLLKRESTDAGVHDGSVSIRSDGGQRRIAMRHTHLPKLAEADFVDWDRETGHISSGSAFAAIRPLLLALVRHEEKPFDHTDFE
ncbi:hypothetical protein OB920_16245 [Halobacteria archaeon HArc-gm2]|nr:hypothetical protein [Halobacteria archaeon HArc-gm2]